MINNQNHTPDLNKIKDDLKILLYKLGKDLAIGFKSKDKAISSKEHTNDILTKYDILLNDAILEHLWKNYPEISIISEESPSIDNNSEYTFIIDPIDGTRNFTKNTPIFYIGIALAKNDDTLLSLTYNPISNELYHAIKDGWAFLNEEKIHVSNLKLSSADVSIGYRKSPKIHKAITSDIVGKIYTIKNTNCVHNDLGILANGRIEWMVHQGAQIRDYCHYLLVQEAWGIVTDWQWEPFNNSKVNIVASNGIIHDGLLEVVKEY